jgi:AcrR family transcriptional regulator
MGIRIEEKKKQKKEALLASAFELFTSKGINNTSISDIAKQAKMAKGTFYLYFKDKYDIRDKLITHKANELFIKAEEEMKGQSFATLEEEVVFLADHIIDQLNDNPVVLQFISKNLSWAVFSNIRIPEKDNMNCMDIFDNMLEESGRQFRQRELMIYLIVELVSSTCHSVVLYGTPCTLDELKTELNTTICGLLHQFEV